MRHRSVHEDGPPRREVDVVEAEVRVATEVAPAHVVVRDHLAARLGVAVDALPAGRVHLVVRAEDERARGPVHADVPALLVEEGPARALAAPDEHLVLPAGLEGLGRAPERRDAVGEEREVPWRVPGLVDRRAL